MEEAREARAADLGDLSACAVRIDEEGEEGISSMVSVVASVIVTDDTDVPLALVSVVARLDFDSDRRMFGPRRLSRTIGSWSDIFRPMDGTWMTWYLPIVRPTWSEMLLKILLLPFVIVDQSPPRMPLSEGGREALGAEGAGEGGVEEGFEDLVGEHNHAEAGKVRCYMSVILPRKDVKTYVARLR